MEIGTWIILGLVIVAIGWIIYKKCKCKEEKE